MTNAASPSSSPRLPSPPPIAEDQLGPKSPGLSLFEENPRFPTGNSDAGASRRIRPGTKAEDMAEGPPMVDLQDIDSAFQLTEYLKALHYSLTHPPSSPNTTIPIDQQLAHQLSQPPPNTSREIWLYELGRFLIHKTNAIIIGLFADSPACSAQTCPEMRASEWQYLCAVHDPPKSCAAIDYCCHTLDWAANTLTNSKMFPSRLGLGSGNSGAAMGQQGDKVLQQQMKELTNIFRRVYRIYAHAWFQHREMFWRVEGKTGLYVMFKTVCDEYGLIQTENYTIPAEAAGQEPVSEEDGGDVNGQKPPVATHTLLRRPESTSTLGEAPQVEPQGNSVLADGKTTKRHRHTLSDRSMNVSTVIHEEAEEDEEAATGVTSDEKPSLERQPTVLKTDDDKNEAGEEQAEDNEEAPQLGMHRSDTLKPEPEAKGEAEAEDDDDDAAEITVIEVDDEDKAPESIEQGEKKKSEEGAEVKDEPAAEPEAAGKSVEE